MSTEQNKATVRRWYLEIFNQNRLEEGKMAETWSNWDFMGMLQQLGVIPTAG